ncbi:MAG: polyphosphate kinase 1 [Bacteroidales bacterium]|jgi:polyphosphate kinase|nr:polyphosphate kinase 1 [Bacteroidales bacterium]
MSKAYIPKEISWLSFNARVLQEAANIEVPLLERFSFLGIYSNNLDEYFRVRVATLRRLSLFSNKAKSLLGYSPKAALKSIQETVLNQNEIFEKTYSDLLGELKKHRIHFVNEEQLDGAQTEFVGNYFRKEVRSRLMPLIISKENRLPNLTDDAIYFAIQLRNSATDKKRYALLEIPLRSILPRFVMLPGRKGARYVIFLDDVIRWGLKEIFSILPYDEITAYTIKVTRDAELEIADDISESYIDKLSRSLQQRKKGSPVRFVHDREMPAEFLKILAKKLNLGSEDVIMPGNRYHNFKDFMSFIEIEGEGLNYPKLAPVRHPAINYGKSILSVIRKRDIMFYFPYHPFDHFIDLLREASIDPFVTSIHITLYRLARNSSVINALMNAARNGKNVTTVVELQARFDEEANIHWGNKLLDEGVKVIYGVPGLKVHSKLCLITRVKGEVTQRYAAIGTGNFNEETARVYTDHLLLTSDKKITNEVLKAFNFFSANYRKDNFYHLLVSPFGLRNKLVSLIENEIRNARAGREARIRIKINNLTDEEIISKLYKAGEAGVEVKLIVRGMFSMAPGAKGVSDNIRAIGIVDRFLEHSRFMIFCNGGDELVYITSADFMPRNLDRRIEVTCPVWDPAIKKEINDVFTIQWNDNVKARILDAELSNRMVNNDEPPLRSQTEIHRYYTDISSPASGSQG